MATETEERVDVTGHRNVNVRVRVEKTDRVEETPEGESEDRHFFYQQKGVTPRPDGVYLDDEQRRAAEGHRARVEGREPDYENPSAITGTPLVQEAALDGGYAKRDSDVVLPVNLSPSDGTTGDAGRTQPTSRSRARGDSEHRVADYTTEAGPVQANTKQTAVPEASEQHHDKDKSDNKTEKKAEPKKSVK